MELPDFLLDFRGELQDIDLPRCRTTFQRYQRFPKLISQDLKEFRFPRFQDILSFQDVQYVIIQDFEDSKILIFEDLGGVAKIPRSSKIIQDFEDLLRFPDLDPFQKSLNPIVTSTNISFQFVLTPTLSNMSNIDCQDFSNNYWQSEKHQEIKIQEDKPKCASFPKTKFTNY